LAQGITLPRVDYTTGESARQFGVFRRGQACPGETGPEPIPYRGGLSMTRSPWWRTSRQERILMVEVLLLTSVTIQLPNICTGRSSRTLR